MTQFVALPPGLSAAEFERALGELRGLLGTDRVVAVADRLRPYQKMMIPAPDEAHVPSGVVMAESVTEVQGILAICNRYRIPLWPTSTGRNFGYGTSSPATRGQLILDLRRMNRILEVDAELGTALVEPGVTYQQLHDYLSERDIPLWLDFPGPGPIVSPLGNTLERGGGNTPYGDHFAHACGMEVVLADGRVLRTGMGSIPNTTSWQVFKYGYGPYLDGIFTQSNFGVVTKLGLWLMPAPPGHRTVLVQFDAEAQLPAAVDTMRRLQLQRVITNVGVMATAVMALSTFKTRAELYDGPGPVPQPVIDAAARDSGIAAWNMTFTLYGTPAQIAPNLAIVTEAFEAVGGRVNPDFHDGSQVNELSLASFGILNWVGGGGLAWFAPVSPARGSDAARQAKLARRILGAHGFDYLAAPTLNGRDLHHLIALVYNRNDADEKQRANRCFEQLVHEFAQHGYGLYRVGIDYMDKLAGIYGSVNRDVNRAIKQALDPNGILAPGKSGIHP
ncbi:MAG: FAD-binding oxidoreductase [Spongiibacteraceae bacterium]|jgi:4-cresol dehydrogenase (hydroxylating)|nr:FAD-binding oxidoreductase [Spongiibacteraceae bacterium]